MPGDRPVAVDDFGTTAQEQYEGEDLDGRLSREEPDQQVEPGPASPGETPGERHRSGRLVAPSQGAGPDEDPDETALEVGPDRGGFSAEEDAMRVEPESDAGPIEETGSRPRTAPD